MKAAPKEAPERIIETEVSIRLGAIGVTIGLVAWIVWLAVFWYGAWHGWRLSLSYSALIFEGEPWIELALSHAAVGYLGWWMYRQRRRLK